MELGALFGLQVPRAVQKTCAKRTRGQTLAAGCHYVWHEKIVLGAISLDLFAVLLGGLVSLVFENVWLGGVIATAMLINLITACLAGILIPLGLDKIGVDPAVSSAVFVTTLTDTIGFFSFLGLAALILFY